MTRPIATIFLLLTIFADAPAQGAPEIDGRLRFITVDGANLRTRDVPIARGEPIWWMAGSLVGEPGAYTMQADTIRPAQADTVLLKPVLTDADGNVLSRVAATWSKEGRLDTPLSIAGEFVATRALTLLK